MRRLTTFVEILAATATSKLQLRFFCQDLLYLASLTSTDIFAERSLIKLNLRCLPQSVLDQEITNNPAALQCLRLALWIMTMLLDKVQMHVTVVVHPAFLRKAKASLVSESLIRCTIRSPDGVSCLYSCKHYS